MVTINRLQVPVQEKGRPTYMAEMAMFIMGNQVMPMVFIGLSEDEIAVAIAERTKEISLASRNTFQTKGPTPIRPVPKSVPQENPAEDSAGSPGPSDVP